MSCRWSSACSRSCSASAGGVRPASAEDQTILVAHDLSPADVIQFKSHHFAAFLTDLGGASSHTAIVARSLNVPAVVATHNARGLIREHELLIVDGAKNVVIVNPDRSVLAEYRLKQGELELARKKLKRLKTTRAATIDGTEIELFANIELPDDLDQALDNGAGGIGLFPQRVPVPESSGTAIGGRAVRGLPASRGRHARQAGSHPHLRSGRRQEQGRPGRPGASRAESGAGLARGAFLSRRAAIVPDAAPRDPARVALRQRPDTASDARLDLPKSIRRWRCSRRPKAACSSGACRSIRRSRSAA